MYILVRKVLPILFVGTCCLAANAQIKIGDNPVTINPGSLLELESTNRGLLFPRLALDSTGTWGLAAGSVPVAGMTVYNTKTITAGFSGSAQYPAIAPDGTGLYYWDGTGWVGNGGVVEPFQVKGTTTKATANTQHIYQMGHIGIGTANPMAPLHMENALSLDSAQLTNNTVSGFATGRFLKNDLTLNNTTARTFAGEKTETNIKAGGVSAINGLYGQQNIINLEASSPDVGNVYGHLTRINDASANEKYVYAGYFLNSQTAPKSVDVNMHGMANQVILNPLNGNLNTAYSYGTISIANAVGASGNISMQGLRGSSSYAICEPATGFTFGSGDLLGGFMSARPTPAGGAVNVYSMFGVAVNLDARGTGSIRGTEAGAVSANLFFDNGSTKTFDNLYGVRIQNYESGGLTTVGNAFGLFITDFRFSGGNNDRSWNIYSQGAATKNYFGGKVGIAEEMPTNALHVKATENPLRLEGLQPGADTDRWLVADAAGVLKTVAPPNVSVTAIKKITEDYSVADDDHTLLADATAGNILLTLPAAAAHTGRILRIRNVSANLLTFNVPVKLSENLNQLNLGGSMSLWIQSDGTDWYVIN